MAHNQEDCKRIFESLSAYLDLELPSGDCSEIERHIQDCPPCIEFVRSLRQSIALCREFRTSEQPGALSDEDRRRLQDAWRTALGSDGK